MNTNSLHDSIKQSMDVLAEQKSVRDNTSLQIMSLVSRIKDCTACLANIKADRRSWKKPMTQKAVDEIVDCTDGSLLVSNFSFQGKSRQNVYLFDGTSWVLLDIQVYYNFVNECCKKMGFPESEQKDCSFMEKVYQELAFRIRKIMTCPIPKNQAWINLLNGTLEIKSDGTTNFRDHVKEDYFCYTLPFAYDPNAKCELWHKFLDISIPDKDTQETLAQYIGYCLDNNTREEKMLALYGTGSNGKSVILEIIENLFGRENTSFLSLSDVSTDDEKRSLIEHKRINISHESDMKLDISTLKRMISGEPVDARKLYIGSYTIYEYPRFITNFNMLPVAEITHGWFRRWILIPMKTTIPDEQQDLDLVNKLVANDLPGIFNWVLDAFKRLKQNGRLFVSQQCKDELSHYKNSSDIVKCFVDECCETSETFSTSAKEVYKSFRQYCYDDGRKPLGKQKFNERMIALGLDIYKYQNLNFFNLRLTSNDGEIL